jgi:hypothetical protein
VWAQLSQGLVNGKIDEQRCRMIAEFRDVDPEKLRQAAQAKLDGTTVTGDNDSEEAYRNAEYDALQRGAGSEHADLLSTVMEPADYALPIQSYFSGITLVHKLRETRAFTGFCRILPEDSRAPTQRRQDLRLDPRIDWLPAVTVRGEGIFLKLDEPRIATWAPRVSKRVDTLRKIVNAARLKRGQGERAITAKFVLLHTLAHLLINELSFECGYGSSSLRERLYCDTEHIEAPMSGILIYTASGDSEGTLGGLVRQGKPMRLERMLIRALRSAQWCSSDPVCVESPGQGPDSCNLAACHACALLPETSCEEGNRLLDRMLLVGSPEQPQAGFFSGFLS